MLKGKSVAVKDLTDAQKKRMFEIMQAHYENISKGVFSADLSKKQDAILLCDEQGEIYGFTTLRLFHQNKVQLVFSGDTIVEPEYWSKNDLSQTWITKTMEYANDFDGKTYWLLLTKGYKTYKLLHTFFNEFYPRYDAETPQDLQKIINDFAISQYSDKYQNGVYFEGKDFLKEEFDTINENKMRDKNTAFFLDKNPDYKKGNELVCLAEISTENLNRLGRKMLGV